MAPNYGSFNASDNANESNGHATNGEFTHKLHRGRSRNERFDPHSEPFRDNRNLQLNENEVNGAVRRMNPTRATFTYTGSAEEVDDDHQDTDDHDSNEQRERNPPSSQTSEIQYKWTSRNNRKGRHKLVVQQSSKQHGSPQSSTSFTSILKGIWRMLTSFAFWDISYLTAIAFTAGILILLTNAILTILPYADPSITLPNEITYVEGALTLLGCLLFLLSSFLSFVEAVNADQQGCFGWKREEVPDDETTGLAGHHDSTTRLVPDWNCIHKRNNYTNFFNSSDESKSDAEGGGCGAANHHDNGTSEQSDTQWRLFPTIKELREHFLYDLGFVTCSVLLFSSIVYTSAALASFISILQMGQISQWIRIPQVIAGVGFAVSSLLFMLETQTKWLVPEFTAIGWQISFWNFIGSIGFILCAAFGYTTALGQEQWSENQMVISYLWGSSGFFLGSLIQWYESLDKHPVEYEERK